MVCGKTSGGGSAGSRYEAMGELRRADLPMLDPGFVPMVSDTQPSNCKETHARCEADGFEQFETRVVEHEPEYFDGSIRPFVIPISVSLHRIPDKSTIIEDQ